MIEAYFGLQYASLFGGQLRFMPAKGPMEIWSGIKIANVFKPVCPQNVVNNVEMLKKLPVAEFLRLQHLKPFVAQQHEDCLYMNVYRPVQGSDVRLLPVLLFVHGESLETGTGNAYDGSVMAAAGNIMVITLNYRLGVFGFFSTGTSHAPGNMAILDIIAGLQYIRENILVFGGNSSDVTVMGRDGGAILVNLLLISPITKGLVDDDDGDDDGVMMMMNLYIYT
ncbi:hypothetical protein HELRODRAFT_91427 [Helobdella robusta]|uniref:Carboxylesterase type B domain-containing protein n=1 Tax=Helobdella robusta TaxID=6412 RepID=T1G837_HELRO|nr:hypothetical protein HELRODRAFT_91427 [Helobdella robusta]ESO11392.1 hypothetical protein HELRODRAFT_91427 [Helobdella robusta]